MTDTTHHTLTPKGVTVSIYRNPGYDCTNGGVSAADSGINKLTIIGVIDLSSTVARDWRGDPADLVREMPRGSRIFAPAEDAPAAYLVIRELKGQRVVHVIPAVEGKSHHGWMFGGSYVGGGDSRWGDLIGFYGAASLHDRRED